MGSLESNTFTFVLTIWIDDRGLGESSAEIVWRGEIRNVTEENPKRLVFRSLDDLPLLILRYLEDRGIQFG